MILDYTLCDSNPPVRRLRWGPRGQGNEWLLGAADFDEFAEMLGLTDGAA
ncbi:MAG TPA: hypothetical protein VFJ58_13115 [Armatimonadota bacterium]|nr:hypothetical protein [Armatimonadota bacterium]